MESDGTRKFVCRGCGACCRVPGLVRLAEGDAEALAGFLGMEVGAFVNAYAELTPSRTGLALRGDPEGPCLFLGADNRCRVYAARPRQCRDYPERWRSAAIEAVCAGRRNEG